MNFENLVSYYVHPNVRLAPNEVFEERLCSSNLCQKTNSINCLPIRLQH